ncbi:MAG: hypothetical protein ACOC6F_01940, partial [bacterium]
GHEAVRMAGPGEAADGLLQDFEECLVISVGVEYVLASIATRRDMVDRALILNAQRASHRQSVVDWTPKIKT